MIYPGGCILELFRLNADTEGKGYQTLTNEALKQVATNSNPVTEEVAQRIHQGIITLRLNDCSQ